MAIKTQNLKIVETCTASKESRGSMVKMPRSIKFKIYGAGFTALSSSVKKYKPSEWSIYGSGVKRVCGAVKNRFNTVHFRKLAKGILNDRSMAKADGMANYSATLIPVYLVPLPAFNNCNSIGAFKPCASKIHFLSSNFPLSSFGRAIMWARSIWPKVVARLTRFTVLKRHEKTPLTIGRLYCN